VICFDELLILPEMSLFMAIWTKGSRILQGVFSALGQWFSMMHFQVRIAIRGFQERSWLVA